MTHSGLADYTQRVLIAAAVAGLAVAVWALADIVVITFGAVVLAAALLALTDPVTRWTGLAPRPALAVVIVSLIVIFVLAFWLIGGQLMTQASELLDVLPKSLARARQRVSTTPLGGLVTRFDEVWPATAASGLGIAARTTIGAAGTGLLILITAIYLALDPQLYRRGLLAIMPRAARNRIESALDASGIALKRWLLGQLIGMVLIGVLTFVALWAIGVPLALPLGILAGLLEFVPVVGPIASAIPGVLVGFSQGGAMPLYVALAYIAIQNVESYVLMPVIQRWAVALPPALGLVSIVGFGLLFGPLGVLVATPLAVVIVVLVDKLYVDTAIEQKPPDPQPARLNA